MNMNKPSFEGLTSTPISRGLRLTPVQEKKETKVTTVNSQPPTPSPRGHA